MFGCGGSKATKPTKPTVESSEQIAGLPRLTLPPQNGLSDVKKFWSLVSKHEDLTAPKEGEDLSQWAAKSLSPFLNSRAESLAYGRELNRRLINQNNGIRVVANAMQAFVAYTTWRELVEKTPQEAQSAIDKPESLLRGEALKHYTRCVERSQSVGAHLSAWITHCKDQKATLDGY